MAAKGAREKRGFGSPVGLSEQARLLPPALPQEGYTISPGLCILVYKVGLLRKDRKDQMEQCSVHQRRASVLSRSLSVYLWSTCFGTLATGCTGSWALDIQ